jgi:DNA polymerase-4
MALARFRAKHSQISSEQAAWRTANAPISDLATPILHIDMDSFFVSVELLSRPELKGKAVVVGGQKHQRGVVTSASYEARKFGVHSAMPLRTAGRLCPHAIFLDNNHELYSEWSHRIAALLTKYSPRVEMASVDEGYIDFGGTSLMQGSPLIAADKLLRMIREQCGLPCSGGLASTRLVAKVASDQAKPQGLVWVPFGMEASFLAPLSVRRIPGIGKKTEASLNALGIRTVNELAAVPAENLRHWFGLWGDSLFQKARGGDSYEFLVDEEGKAKSISHDHTFGVDTNDRATLESTLSFLAQKAGKRLRDAKQFVGTVSVKIRFTDFRTVSRSKTLPEPTELDAIITGTAKKLFVQSWNGKATLRLIGVSLESLTTQNQQISLLDTERNDKMEQLARTTDKLRDKFGFSSIQMGSSIRRRKDSDDS